MLSIISPYDHHCPSRMRSNCQVNLGKEPLRSMALYVLRVFKILCTLAFGLGGTG